MRRAAWALALGLTIGGTLFFFGCGSNLTGGSIPPGRSRVHGLVVRGDVAGVPLPGATVRFEPITTSRQQGGTNLDPGNSPPPPPDFGNNGGSGSGGGGGTVTPVDGVVEGRVETTAGAGGAFDINTVRPGPQRVTVIPPAGSGLTTIVYQIDVPADAGFWIVAAPPVPNITTGGFTGIQVEPNPVVVKVGQAITVDVRLLGGAPPVIVPSFLIRGDAAIINDRARLTGLQAGRATMQVVVGPYSQTVPIIVNPID